MPELVISASAGKGLARPALTGTVRGIPVRIDTYTQRSGSSNTTYTRYRVGNEVTKELFGGNDLSFETRSTLNSRYNRYVRSRARSSQECQRHRERD